MHTSFKYYFLLICACFLLYSSCERKPYSTGPDIYIEDPSFRVVGYLGTSGFDRIDQLELNRLTFLNLAFANPDSEGNLKFRQNTDIKPVVKKGHDAGLKVLVSLAGGGRPDTTDWKHLKHMISSM